jgi:hypothetical protein
MSISMALIRLNVGGLEIPMELLDRHAPQLRASADGLSGFLRKNLPINGFGSIFLFTALDA